MILFSINPLYIWGMVFDVKNETQPEIFNKSARSRNENTIRNTYSIDKSGITL